MKFLDGVFRTMIGKVFYGWIYVTFAVGGQLWCRSRSSGGLRLCQGRDALCWLLRPDDEFVWFVVDVGAVSGAVFCAVEEVRLLASGDVDGVDEAVLDEGV